MNDSSDLKAHIQPFDNAHWQTLIADYRDYLKACREWLTTYQKTQPVQDITPRKRDTGLPRDAQNHRSTFVYLKAA